MKIDSHKVKVILAEKMITMSQLAVMSGISRQTLSAIISRGSCSLVSAGKIAHSLNISVDTIAVKKEE